MQNLEELLRKAEEIRQEVRVGGNTAQRVGLVLVQLVDTAQALLAQIQEEERLRQETDASIKKDINTLDEKVEDLPSPVAPLSNNNGLLELKYDTDSLYVQDGRLCARLPETDPSDPVPGAGVIYSEGAGISIDDENTISVRIDKSLELNNNGAIRVGTGEGLVHNKEGRLSINIGKGLGFDEYSNKIVLEDSDYIKSLPALFEKKQDVIEAGNGLEKVGNLLKVEDTLVSDVSKSKQLISSLQVDINQQSIQISSKQDKLSEGLGIIINDKNEIAVNGNVLSVMHATNASNDASGRSISGTYATQEEVGSVVRSLAGVETRVGANAAAIEELRLKEEIIFGDGLSHVGNVVEIDSSIISGIADNTREIGSLKIGKQDKLTASDGINLDDGKLSVHIGTGLDFDPESSAVVVKVGAGVKTDINQSLTIKHDATLTTDADGQLGVNQGTITSIAASEVAKVVANAPANYDTLKEIADYIATDAEGAAQLSNRIGALESALPNKMDTIAFGSGLAFSSNVVKVADAVMTDIANNKSNISKLQSSVDGLSTSKQDTISDLATIRSNAANGATAYGWGDHSKGGYAKQARLHNKNIPTDASGTIILPDYPTSLPANGGNAEKADKLSTLRSIWGQSFDGSGDVSGIAYFPNGDLIYAKDEGGTYRYVMGLTSVLSLGHGSAAVGIDTYILGKNIHFRYYDTDYKFAMSILNNGKVGIGTTEPQATLDVNGYVRTKGIDVTEGGIHWPSVTSATWETFGPKANYGLKILNTIGQPSTGAPSDFAVGLSVSAYYGFCLAYYGGGNVLWFKGSADNTWERIIHTGNLSTHFTDGFENVNGTIKISTSYITEKIKGDGLVLDESGKMSVDSGVARGQIAINVEFPDPSKLQNEGFLSTDYASSGYPLDSYLQAICKWAIHTYPNKGGVTLVGEISPTVSGTCILNLYSNEGYDSNTKLPRYCSGQYLSLDGYLYVFNVVDYKYSRTTMPRFSDIPTSLPANGGNADTLDGHDSSYFATKNELGNKQDTLAFGSGIAHSNNTIWVDGSQLNVNYANSAGSVAWGNVSGRPSFGNGFDSTNNVVQLKLSTGLAIDDRGYLYVTGL